MRANLDDASVGMDAETGRYLTGWAHVVQSLNDIFLTRFGSRIMREWYGSFVPEALGRNISPADLVPVIASITSAIEQWEPRYVVDRIAIPEATRQGRLELVLEGRFRPRAHLGDLTDEVPRPLRLTVTGTELRADRIEPEPLLPDPGAGLALLVDEDGRALIDNNGRAVVVEKDALT